MEQNYAKEIKKLKEQNAFLRTAFESMKNECEILEEENNDYAEALQAQEHIVDKLKEFVKRLKDDVQEWRTNCLKLSK